MKPQIENLLWEDSINRKHPNEANSGEKNGLTKHQWLLKRESFWNNYRGNSCRRRWLKLRNSWMSHIENNGANKEMNLSIEIPDP